MYVLALIITLATGELELLTYAPGDVVKRFDTKAECQEVLGRVYDQQVAEDPGSPFALACITPAQHAAVRKRLEDRAKKTLHL